jgi:nucleotide-binding universal stress UspA family protein
LPRRSGDMERWARVRTVYLDPETGELPPIEVYQVGEAYFVLDGNHRVSIARREGVEYIEAKVIEIQTPVPLTPDITPDDLICKAEYVEFLQETGLGDASSEFDLSVAQCGQYPKLKEQIAVHQLLSSREQGREVSFHEAAADWLATVYAPLALAIREHGLLRWFPDHTETDLYLWVVEHQQALEGELGREIRPQAVMTDLAVRSNPRAKQAHTSPDIWRRERLADRYLEHLFQDLLVPLSGAPESWNALEQAIVIAQRESASVHGLHIVRTEANKSSSGVAELQAHFRERCAAANPASDFVVEVGDVSDKIRERALLADLLVLHVSHPPTGRLSSLTSSWHSILNHAARPVLAVSGEPSPMQRALLVFDGSLKARQALFVAAYMGEAWKTALTVLTVGDGAQTSADTLDYARAYLDLHELEADYISAEGSSRIILDTMAERNLDLLLIGSDPPSHWQQVLGGSVVNNLLRECSHPLLVCQ